MLVKLSNIVLNKLELILQLVSYIRKLFLYYYLAIKKIYQDLLSMLK